MVTHPHMVFNLDNCHHSKTPIQEAGQRLVIQSIISI